MTSHNPTMTFPSVAALIGGPTSPMTVKRGVIDLWSCSLEASAAVLAHCHTWLSDEERARAARFVRSEDQTRFTLAHGSLRFLLGRYGGVEPAELRFQSGSSGKPALQGQQRSVQDLRFNLSHSHGRMLVAVASEVEVGVDLEQLRGNVEALKLAERFYSTAEYEGIKHRPSSEHALEFYRLWVAKEAVLKAQGIGIPSLQDCEIVALPDSFLASVRVLSDRTIQEGWTIRWLNCGSGWQGAVSALGNDWSIRILEANGR